jgi:U3 small nucleolar RNA-associated protein 4
LVFANNTLQIYDVEIRQFPVWGKEISNNLPRRLRHAHDPILGVAFEPVEKASNTDEALPHAVFWGSTWMCKLPLKGSATARPNKKRQRESTKQRNATIGKDDDNSKDFKMIVHYRPILFLDFLAANELVVVERPLVDVLSDLPPAYFRHKYGAS